MHYHHHQQHHTDDNINNSNVSQPPIKQEELYGGAITISVPTSFTNVSDVRQVPDNQEVFMDDSSGASLIVELMEYVNAPDSEACVFHFNELARMNKAKSHQVMEMSPPHISTVEGNNNNCNNNNNAPRFSRPIYEQMMMGRQNVAKFNEEGRENDVAIFLGLRRIPPPVATDILVTISYAFHTDVHSSDNRRWETRYSPEDIKNIGANVLTSLQIHDFGLFVPEGVQQQEQNGGDDEQDNDYE